ncbi:MAG TPA: BCD family MFS transporter, partial [Anaerolineales bacterium]|nr:BCD family MFS transporter [Anaerolineales bacterium]
IQLGLLHVAVAMTLVPINSTLNRVMIKELSISATLVAILASLPYLFSPIQVAIGSFSDRHPLWGLRRTPYIVLGLLLCVLGLVLSPQAAFLLADNWQLGTILGVAAFGAWGMGFNFATVAYLSLASELSGEKNRGRTIAVMWFMMIVSIVVTAIGLSQMVDPYTPQAMVRAFRVIGLAALSLGLIGLVRLESRRAQTLHPAESQSWGILIKAVLENRQASLFFWYLIILLAAILGQDILLEPFGGEAFGMAVKDTTRITSIWGGCVLLALVIAGAFEGRVAKRLVASIGALVATLGFILIVASGLLLNQMVFYTGVVLLGSGTGLATVSNLSLMLDMTTPSKVGLFIGAWGMANAISRLIGSVLGGAVRDLVTQLSHSPIIGYIVVFGIEAGLLLISLLILRQIDVGAFQQQSRRLSLTEQAALSAEA